MNLPVRGIHGQIAHGDTFHNDRNPELIADFILVNPPFNVSDWDPRMYPGSLVWCVRKPGRGLREKVEL